MHFQLVNDDYYSNLLEILRLDIPEFKPVSNDLDDLYPIIGELGRFIIQNSDNLYIISKCFAFINKSLMEGGHKTEDLIVIQIFEQLYEIKQMVELAERHLDGKALQLFKKYKAAQ